MEEDTSGLDDLLVCLGQVCLALQQFYAFYLALSGRHLQDGLVSGVQALRQQRHIGASAATRLAIE